MGGGRRWLLGCLGVSGVSALLCCCGAGIGTWYLPEIVVALATSDAPLDIEATAHDPARQEALKAELRATLDRVGTVRIDAPTLNVLLAPGDDGRIQVAMDGGTGTFDASIPTDGSGWVNVHVKGTFVMEHGWVESATIDELKLSDWDLGGFMVGQNVAPQFNKSLSDQRVQHPELAALLDATERVAIEDGVLVVTLDRERTPAPPVP
ncbi:MAG: hypothetical protein EXR71_01535 [Myxococcales bacterium]|nr:hypothetical protein [Myxococcales bacterium]